MEDSKSNPVNDIPPQNPIPNSDPNPPQKPSPTLSQQPPPPPPPPSAAETAPMPSPPSTAPVSIPPSPAAAPVSVPPPQPARATVPPPPRSNKRPLDGNAQIQDCSYFKIRAVLKDMRPHLLEAMRTVDFRNCKAADEVKERLELLMQLYKEMTADAVTLTKCKNEPEGQKLSSENGAVQNPEHLQDVKNAADDKEAIDLEVQSSYIGGSAFGWNYVTFSGNKAVYYGRTKESYRAAQKALLSASASPS